MSSQYEVGTSVRLLGCLHRWWDNECIDKKQQTLFTMELFLFSSGWSYGRRYLHSRRIYWINANIYQIHIYYISDIYLLYIRYISTIYQINIYYISDSILFNWAIELLIIVFVITSNLNVAVRLKYISYFKTKTYSLCCLHEEELLL